MSLSYATEKLAGAVRILVGGDPLKDRLFNAVAYDLMHVPVSDLPDEVRDQFREVMGKLTAFKDPVDADSGGDIKDSLALMSLAEMEEVAMTIATVYGAAEQALGQ